MEEALKKLEDSKDAQLLQDDSDLLTSKRKEQQRKAKALDPLDDTRNYDFPVSFGAAFVEFTSVTEAKRARRNIHLLKFGGRLVECEYHDEVRFELNDFKRLEPLKRETRDQEFEGLENCAIEFTEPRQSEPMKI